VHKARLFILFIVISQLKEIKLSQVVARLWKLQNHQVQYVRWDGYYSKFIQRC